MLVLLIKMYSGIPMIGISNWYIMISRKVIIGNWIQIEYILAHISICKDYRHFFMNYALYIYDCE